jgi:tetratricopeptide (TPR) repeat protein
LTWHDEKDARLFTRAFNRLVYDARKGTADDDLAAFGAQAAQMRSAGTKPPEGWEKYQLLAEQAVKDTDYVKAINNYEDGVAAYPLWAEGWFNAALLYDGLKEYESAANRMRHYLILDPNAPDAKAARDKIVIWDDKAKS